MMNRALAKALNLPRTRLFGLLGILAAMLTLMMGSLLGSGALLQNLYTHWDLSQRQSLMVYLPPNTPTEALTPLHTAFSQNPALEHVRILPPEEVEAAIAPAFPGAETTNLPLPLVAEVAIKPGQPREAVMEMIQKTYPTAELDDQQPMVEAVAQNVRLLQTAGVGLSLALGGILALFMALTIRAGLLAQHDTVALLIQLGASDRSLAATMAVQAAQPITLGALVGVLLTGAGLMAAHMLWGVSITGPVVGMILLPLPTLPLLAMAVAMLVAQRLLHHA